MKHPQTFLNKISLKYSLPAVSIILLGGFIIFLIYPPKSFPVAEPIVIDEGGSLRDISFKLQDENIIRSPFWFRAFTVLLRGERNIQAGEYYFQYPKSSFGVAKRMSTGDYGITPIRITIVEGWNIFDIAEKLEEDLYNFNREEFLDITEEGYMFPDTYFFFPNTNTEKTVRMMRDNFNKRIEPLMNNIEEFPYSLDEVVNMASILETEAHTKESKRKIADILWKRLESGMPLQVDVSFRYVNNKTTYDLTLEDLELDHPYNTYRFPGLPPTPIANPGLESIKAAIDPIKTEYWYFLSDLSGNMYYARDFDEHQTNRKNYLRRFAP